MNRLFRFSVLNFAILTLCLGAPQATAQIQIAGGLGVSRSTNSYLRHYHPGAGLDLRVRWMVAEQIGIGINTGYYAHGHRGNNKHAWSRFGYLPFAAAADVFFPVVDRLRLYVGAEAGLYGFFATYWDDDYYFGPNDGFGEYSYRSYALRLGLGVEAGLQFDIADPIFLYTNLGLRGVFVSDYWGYGAGTTGLGHVCIGIGATLN